MKDRDSAPAVVANRPDAERSGIACQALLLILVTDPRVKTVYELWKAGRNLPTLIAEFGREQTHEHWEAVCQAIFREERTDRVLLHHLMEDLGLDYDWLPHLLLAQWRVLAKCEAIGAEPETFQFKPKAPEAVTQAPGESATAYQRRVRAIDEARWPNRGRRPKNGPSHQEDIPRYVRWYYRAKIKDPRDSVSSLAREYASTANPVRTDDCRSVVQHGIARAKSLLAFIAGPPSTPVPK